MLANQSHRFEHQPLFTCRRTNARTWIVWSQEVRSHFFGHVGLIDTDGLFWTWIRSHGCDIHANDDHPNA